MHCLLDAAFRQRSRYDSLSSKVFPDNPRAGVSNSNQGLEINFVLAYAVIVTHVPLRVLGSRFSTRGLVRPQPMARNHRQRNRQAIQSEWDEAAATAQ
jgi:hypothetical protein